ncbi:MAG: YggT family protein [Proteobacteria bacterium]|nr:YggT family protein [Pseudomonadota bacterium]
MDVILVPMINLFLTVIELYIWVVIIAVVLGWLVSFKVVNTSNRFVYMVGDFTYRATEPALKPIRNVLPKLGGIDISPIVLIVLLYFLKDVLVRMMT